MKKGFHFFGILLMFSLIISTGGQPMRVYATQNTGDEQGRDTGNEDSAGEDAEQGEADSEQQETQPDQVTKSYQLPIETNDIDGWPQGEKIEADAAIVMDASTGTVLYGKNIEAKEYPASITKIMTTLLALEYGNLDDVITFSENAVYSIEPDSTHLGIGPGEQLTLRQSLYGVMLASANEISNGVAEHIGGSIENFAEMMNQKAKELGCVNTHFVNANGLHNDDHYTCAKDMALIMQAALKNRTFRNIIKTEEYSYPKTNICDEERYFINHHKMLFEDEEACFNGCLGGKTGFTDQAWNTLVTYAKRGSMKLISVVLHENGAPKAYEESGKILNYGFDNFKKVTIKNLQENKTFGDIIGLGTLGSSGVILKKEFLLKPFVVDKETTVILPVNGKESDLSVRLDLKNHLREYLYNGAVVGESEIQAAPFMAIQAARPQFAAQNVMTETASQDSLAVNGDMNSDTDDKGKDKLEVIRDIFISTYEKVELFIRNNTVESAVLGGILLIIFLPMFVVALSRNRKYKIIKRERNAADEMNRRLEEELAQKSLQEIENEIRSSQEEETRAKMRIQRRNEQAEEAKRKLEEAERILAGEDVQRK